MTDDEKKTLDRILPVALVSELESIHCMDLKDDFIEYAVDFVNDPRYETYKQRCKDDAELQQLMDHCSSDKFVYSKVSHTKDVCHLQSALSAARSVLFRE